jgi:crotonobetainyl-CoA:carnitine CoA-transferase CaiB-like acyl-CoA transferase
MNNTISRAYENVKVVDLTHYISGPYCTKLLAENGADVLKVEKPLTGDIARREGPFLHDEPGIDGSGLFLYLNTGKKSVTLDIRAEAGKKILLKLIEEADVVWRTFGRAFSIVWGWVMRTCKR